MKLAHFRHRYIETYRKQEKVIRFHAVVRSVHSQSIF